MRLIWTESETCSELSSSSEQRELRQEPGKLCPQTKLQHGSAEGGSQWKMPVARCVCVPHAGRGRKGRSGLGECVQDASEAVG